MLTQSRLKQLLHYDPETGVFTWRVSPCNRVRTVSVAGSLGMKGYRRIRIDRSNYFAHRLAWLYMHGQFPCDKTDHINGVKDDNRIANLRAATDAQNSQNRAKQSNNTSGIPGVYWSSKNKKWCAMIGINRRRKYIGYFDDPEAAHAAYLAAKAELHTFNPTVRAA